MPSINRNLTLIALFILLLVNHFTNSQKVYAASVIKTKATNMSSFSIQSSEIDGWTHLETELGIQKLVNLSPTNYRLAINQVNDKNQPSLCISTILVRKLANWHQQHTNGIKINLAQRKLSFGHFKGFNFAISVYHENSVQPTIELAQDYYKEEIETGSIKLPWLRELLKKPPELTLTLFGTEHDNQNISTPMATFSYKIMPTNGKNIVNISSESFNYYWQQNYQEEMVNQDVLANYKISGMLFTLDTSTNKTLRSFMSNEYKQDFPKTIKELLLELALTIENPIINVSLDKVTNK